MQQWRLREAEDWRREIEERHRPKPESTVDHSPMVIPTPRALSAAKQAQLKHIDEDDERNDEKDDETPKNDLVGDRNPRT
jgi:midasin (ATPase involved in ribosome maturation)